MLTQEELQADTSFDFQGPIIAFCPDWRVQEKPDGSRQYLYMKGLFEFYKRIVKDNGGMMYVMAFEEKASSLNGKIDGWIIPGGRDIDPKYYGQENTASEISEQAKERWAFT